MAEMDFGGVIGVNIDTGDPPPRPPPPSPPSPPPDPPLTGGIPEEEKNTTSTRARPKFHIALQNILAAVSNGHSPGPEPDVVRRTPYPGLGGDGVDGRVR